MHRARRFLNSIETFLFDQLFCSRRLCISKRRVRVLFLSDILFALISICFLVPLLVFGNDEEDFDLLLVALLYMILIALESTVIIKQVLRDPSLYRRLLALFIVKFIPAVIFVLLTSVALADMKSPHKSIH